MYGCTHTSVVGLKVLPGSSLRPIYKLVGSHMSPVFADEILLLVFDQQDSHTMPGK